MLKRIFILCGAVALIAATAIDTLAVLGRHLGLPLTGSIELMQAAVLVSGASSIVLATISDSHPRVRVVIERLEGTRRAVAERLSTVLSATFFLLALGGSSWIAVELWASHEMSEVVGVPWRLLRLFANLCLLAALIITLGQLVGRVRR